MIDTRCALPAIQSPTPTFLYEGGEKTYFDQTPHKVEMVAHIYIVQSNLSIPSCPFLEPDSQLDAFSFTPSTVQ